VYVEDMAIQFLPIVGALSNVAGTALGIYRKTNDERKQRQAQAALIERIEKLEDADVEQTGLISDLAADLEQFARAVQAEIEAGRKREARIGFVACASFVTAVASLILSGILLFK